MAGNATLAAGNVGREFIPMSAVGDINIGTSTGILFV